jgi:hypothetical protein
MYVLKCGIVALACIGNTNDFGTRINIVIYVFYCNTDNWTRQRRKKSPRTVGCPRGKHCEGVAHPHHYSLVTQKFFPVGDGVRGGLHFSVTRGSCTT